MTSSLLTFTELHDIEHGVQEALERRSCRNLGQRPLYGRADLQRRTLIDDELLAARDSQPLG